MCAPGFRGNDCSRADPCGQADCGPTTDTHGHCVAEPEPLEGCRTVSGWVDLDTTTLTASDSWNNHPPTAALPSSSSSWSQAEGDTDPWIQADFGRTIMVESISTWGRGNFDQWVTVYEVSTSMDGETWSFITDPFDAYQA